VKPGDEPMVQFTARKGDTITGYAAFGATGVWSSEPTVIA